MFTLLMGEGVEEPERRNVIMASFSTPNPEFVKLFEQKRKDEKNIFNQTFIDDLEHILAKIKSRTVSTRAFSNSIGVEVKVVDQSDIKLLGLVQTALKLNQDNINLIIALSDYFPLLFSIFASSNWNSTVHILFIEVIKTCLQVNKSKQIIDRLTENSLLVKTLHECTKGTNAFVDPHTKKFRKAYCGAVNEVGTLINKLTGEQGQSFKVSSLWTEFFDDYLGPIIAIERTDRDDVFAKVNRGNEFVHSIDPAAYSNVTRAGQYSSLIPRDKPDDQEDQDDDKHNTEEFEDENDNDGRDLTVHIQSNDIEDEQATVVKLTDGLTNPFLDDDNTLQAENDRTDEEDKETSEPEGVTETEPTEAESNTKDLNVEEPEAETQEKVQEAETQVKEEVAEKQESVKDGEIQEPKEEPEAPEKAALAETPKAEETAGQKPVELAATETASKPKVEEPKEAGAEEPAAKEEVVAEAEKTEPAPAAASK
jgi:hypothetical protein